MNRIKVIDDPSDLVSILNVANTYTKKEVFQELSTDWRTIEEIEKKYGEDGKNAVLFLEKIKIAEVQWVNTPQGPVKSYKCYYNHVQITLTLAINDLADILYVANISDKEIEKYEKKVIELMDDKATLYIGSVTEALKISSNFLKGIIQRSNKLVLKGHNIEKLR